MRRCEEGWTLGLWDLGDWETGGLGDWGFEIGDAGFEMRDQGCGIP